MGSRAALAAIYRPKTWDEVVGQETIKQILNEEITRNQVKRALLFTGPAGTGKTTNARIFADKIEPLKANHIELNAADHRGVDDMRVIMDQCKSRPLQGSYKIFILDEVHSLTNDAQNSLLKILEETPSFCIFILCTTDPQKLLNTILSRVYRYDFQKIAFDDIVKRLQYILECEQKLGSEGCGIQTWQPEALRLIAKYARGGLRDAVTTLDKCVGFSKNLKISDVISVLGVTQYDIQFDILDALRNKSEADLITKLEEVYRSGKDIKLFVKNFLAFVLDVNKYIILKDFEYIDIPDTYVHRLNTYTQAHQPYIKYLLVKLMELNVNMKYEVDPKTLLESSFLLEVI